MNQPPTSPAFGFTPTKLGLVIGLSIVLVGTLAYQFSGGSTQAVVLKKRDVQQRPDAPVSKSASAGSLESLTGTSMSHGKWPQISFADATAFDPFAFPIALSKDKTSASQSEPLLQPSQPGPNAQTAVANPPESSATKSAPTDTDVRADSRSREAKRRLEEQRAIAAELQRRGVAVILRTSSGSVARIGDIEVRVGDVVNGLRVAEIGPLGVRFVAEADEARQSDPEQ